MPDIVDAATRSRMMSRIRGRDTGPEMRLRQALRRAGHTGYRCHYTKVPGRPDVAFVGRRIAVFVDGGFWHGHPDYFTFGKSGPRWDEKITKNLERDRRVNAQLEELGWTVVRVWDFELERDEDAVVKRITDLLSARRPSVSRLA